MTGNHWSDWEPRATPAERWCWPSAPLVGVFTEDDDPSPERLAELVEAELQSRRDVEEGRLR